MSIDAQLAGFDGKHTSGLALARAQGIKLYPTIVLVDGTGGQLAAPLRGYGVPDFYAATIAARIDDARRAMGKRP